MSSPPRQSERKRASETPARKPLSQRLPHMSDAQLTTYQRVAGNMIADPEHPKHATAVRAMPMIEAEIRRRADGLLPPWKTEPPRA